MDYLTWIVIPLLIFCARIIDVSIGTIRMIFIYKGNRIVAPLLGFFEVIIWLLAIRQIMVNLTNFVAYIAYGAGFATGTLIGMIIADKLSNSRVIIRVITRKDAGPLLAALKQVNQTAINVGARGEKGHVQILFMVTHKDMIADIVAIIKEFNPRSFYTIEYLNYASEPAEIHRKRPAGESLIGFFKKGK